MGNLDEMYEEENAIWDLLFRWFGDPAFREANPQIVFGDSPDTPAIVLVAENEAIPFDKPTAQPNSKDLPGQGRLFE